MLFNVLKPFFSFICLSSLFFFFTFSRFFYIFAFSFSSCCHLHASTSFYCSVFLHTSVHRCLELHFCHKVIHSISSVSRPFFNRFVLFCISWCLLFIEPFCLPVERPQYCPQFPPFLPQRSKSQWPHLRSWTPDFRTECMKNDEPAGVKL